ncbi:hypothetical protein [Ruania halotolerans]|uniref:hypothetical protein n=1 Tax=Ruania halotolerans TaxID=2897773 RepID=UPI001E38A08D|nr:hypothetical protein [Ruania halotolerans]UFU04940.1 hypothetical protein LQF10_10650 [Ruania halotolerans]
MSDQQPWQNASDPNEHPTGEGADTPQEQAPPAPEPEDYGSAEAGAGSAPAFGAGSTQPPPAPYGQPPQSGPAQPPPPSGPAQPPPPSGPAQPPPSGPAQPPASGPTQPPPSGGAHGQPSQGIPYGQSQPGGFAQPQHGGYSQPPQGVPYGQPQQGGYGQPQPGPYGQPQGQYAPIPTEPQATDAFSWAWGAFKAHWSTFVLGQLAWAAIIAVVSVLWFVILGAIGVFGSGMQDEAALVALTGAGFFSILLFIVVVVLVSVFAAAGVAHAAIKVVRGEQVSVGDFFKIPNAGHVLLTTILISLTASLSSVLVVGPLVVMFFAVYANFFLIDRRDNTADAIGNTIKMAIGSVGQTIILILLTFVAAMAASITCGIGSLVTVPLSVMATAWMYQQNLGRTPALR